MRFPLKTIFVAISVVAIILAAYKRFPTLTLSVALLGTLPFLVGLLVVTRRFARRRQLVAWTMMPLAAFGFYVGLLGPLTAFLVMPEELGFERTRDAIGANLNRVYFVDNWDRIVPSQITDAIGAYQKGWASFIGRGDEVYLEP